MFTRQRQHVMLTMAILAHTGHTTGERACVKVTATPRSQPHGRRGDAIISAGLLRRDVEHAEDCLGVRILERLEQEKYVYEEV